MFGDINKAFGLIASNINTTQSMTYAFSQGIPSYVNGVSSGYLHLSGSGYSPYSFNSPDFFDVSSQLSGNVSKAFSDFSGFAQISFTSASESSADIIISGLAVNLYQQNPVVGLPPRGIAAITALPQSSNGPFASDAIFTSAALVPGSPIQNYVSHELLHSIGLLDADSVTSWVSSDRDARYTIMSYSDHGGVNRRVSELQIYDIAAIQAVYGRNDQLYSGNTVHNYFATVDGLRAFGLWDADGEDEIDASAVSNAVMVDLRPGFFSSLGDGANFAFTFGSNNAPNITNVGALNMSIAFGAYIENARGSSNGDLMIGNILSNKIYGGAGDDAIYGEGFEAPIDPGDGNYSRVNSTAPGYVEGPPPGVALFTGDGSFQTDWLYGGAGKDRIFGGRGWDTLYGEADNDFLKGGSGNDTLYGGDGKDTLDGGKGEDVLDGGADSDELSFVDSSSPITIVRVNGTTIRGGGDPASDSYGDTYLNFEKILGSANGDTIALSDRPFWIEAGNGFDTITAGTGSDTIKGNLGNDSINGGSGNDVIHGGDGYDTLIGGNGNDDIYTGASGADVDGGVGADLIVFGNNPTQPNSIVPDPSAQDSILRGGAGNDKIIIAEIGKGEIIGGAGNDLIQLDVPYAEFLYKIEAGMGRDVINPHPTAGYSAIRIDIGDYQISDLKFTWKIEEVGEERYENTLDGLANSWSVSGDVLIQIVGTSDSVLLKDIYGHVSFPENKPFSKTNTAGSLEAMIGNDWFDAPAGFQLSLFSNDDNVGLLHAYRYSTGSEFSGNLVYALASISSTYYGAESFSMTGRPTPSEFFG